MRKGGLTYTIPDEPHSWDSFVASVIMVLPLDPPIQKGVWDALRDSLWEGLNELRADKVAIVWPGSAQLHPDADANEQALQLFSVLVSELADPEATGGHITRLLVLLA